MKTCILTVIKNEHEYLDEWIRYHLDLGIDHIFIFEDIDSESHKEITDKYGNKVSLNSISIVLDDENKKKVIEYKLTKSKNPQEIYFPKGLTYIKNHNEYDQCFVIDNDEFITFEDESSNLNDILSLYNDYDAFLLQWKCYGANGYINKPNYSDKGVIETYTKESTFPGHYFMKWTTKVCYKISTFKEYYFLGAHQPTDECKWCKTDFSKSIEKQVFNNIFLRHYITKSWEEYISKRKRGYFVGLARTADFFFIVNNDMLNKRGELLKELKKETLVVLPYKQSGSQGNEIRLALNGWRKYCQFDYHFVVIGEFDESLKNEFPWVKFISCKTKEKKEGQYNPHLDIQNKFNIISKNYSQVYNGFIWMVDDNYAIKPFTLEDITTTYYLNPSFSGQESAPTFYWDHDKWKTRQLLDREGLPHINYTTHYPCYFEFNKLRVIQDKFNMKEESYVLEDIYFNYFSHPEPLQVNCIRLGIWSKMDFDRKFQDAVNDPNIKFICNSVEGWSKELEQELSKLVE